MQRWVALGMISDNLVNIGRALSARSVDLATITAAKAPPANTAGLALPHAINQRSESINFAPGSS
jgi:hypothetical protein